VEVVPSGLVSPPLVPSSETASSVIAEFTGPLLGFLVEQPLAKRAALSAIPNIVKLFLEITISMILSFAS
jgi:hypothetical protein